MSTRLDKSSRLLLSDYLEIDGIEFFDILDLPNYIHQTNDLEHFVIEGDRLDLIAYKYYQDSALGWVIAWANDIEISPADLTYGTYLIVPDPTYIRNNLLKTNSER